MWEIAMKTSVWLRLLLVALLALFVLPGCDDDDHRHDDAEAEETVPDDSPEGEPDDPADSIPADPGTVLVRDRMDDLRVGAPEFVRELANPGTGTVIAHVYWDVPQPVRAAFRNAATREVLADQTSATSPFELAVDTREGQNYFFYLGNPGGPEILDVSYRISFFAP